MTKLSPADKAKAESAINLLRGNSHEVNAARHVLKELGLGGSNNGGDVTPDPDAVPQLGSTGTIRDLAQLRKEAEDETDPVRKEELSSKYTLEALRALHRRSQAERARKAAVVDDNVAIKRLRELYESPDLSADLKMKVGEVLTRNDLAKSAAQESQERTNALVRHTQANVTRRSAGGPTGNPSGQIASIADGSKGAESLGGVSPVGNRGANTGHTGKIEPEPAAQLQQVNDELAKCTDSVERARLGETKTRLLLALSHGSQ